MRTCACHFFLLPLHPILKRCTPYTVHHTPGTSSRQTGGVASAEEGPYHTPYTVHHTLYTVHFIYVYFLK